MELPYDHDDQKRKFVASKANVLGDHDKISELSDDADAFDDKGIKNMVKKII
jgi:hypothetical protein